MEWSSCLQYQLYIYRMELRRQRRREDILHATKAAITNHLILHKPEQDEAAEVEDIKQKHHSGPEDILPETKAPVTDQLTFYPLEPEKSIQCEITELVDTFEFNFLDNIQINEFNTNFNNVFKSDARSALQEFNDYYINF